MDGFTLWLKDGDIVIDEDGKPILCDTCPCGMVIDITCPQALHTLGEANPYYVTVTYPAPSADNKLPAMSLDYSPGAIHPGMAVAVAPGYSSNLEWSGEPGDKTRTLGPVYIRATGAISEEHGRTGTVTLTAWDPDLVDGDGEPLYPVACSFPVYDEVSCAITGPAANVCAGDGFDIRIELTGQGAVYLERMDDDNEAMPVNRFLISWLNLDMVDVESGWANGVWTASGASVETPGAAYIRLDEFGEEICRKNLTGKECGVSDIQVTCPESLHTLGDGGELEITATYTDIGLYSVPPDVRILDEAGNDARHLLIDTATGWPPVFTQGWATIGGTRVWSGTLRVDSVPATARVMALVVEASHPRHTDNSGDVIRVECDLAINDLVKCDSMGITAFGKGGCVGDAFGIDALLVGTLDEELTRMDSPDTGLFGPHGRFRVTITGDWSITSGGTSLNETWLDGAYTSPALRIEEGDGSLADIKATIKEHVDGVATVLCEDTLSPKECGVDASVACPSSLHTLGPAKRLRIAFEYTDELYTPSLDIAMYRTVDGVTTPVGFPYPFVMEHPSGSTEPIDFSEDEWAMEGMDKVWEHDIRINTLTEEGEAIRIDVWAPWKDQDGGHVVLATCAMTLHQLVRCDGGVDMPEECCVDETVGATITVKGSNGDPLPRMDGDMSPRFTVSVTGGGSAILPLDFSRNAAWDEGVWRCPSITPNDVDASPVAIALNDTMAADPLCEGEMEVVECGFTAAVSCPQALHTLGPDGTLTITLTYENKRPAAPYPVVRLLDSLGAPSSEVLLDEDGDPVSFGPLAWEDGETTRTWSQLVHINTVSHSSHRTNLVLAVYDAAGAQKLAQCSIDLSNLITCSVTAPSQVCQGDPFSISIHVQGNNGVALTRFSPSPGGRFTVPAPDITLPDGESFYQGWDDGDWSTDGAVASASTSVAIADSYNASYGCSRSITARNCSISANFTYCPSSLHIYGGSATLRLVATYGYYSLKGLPPVVEVSHPDCIKDTGAVQLDFTTGWSGSSTKTWSKSVQAYCVPPGGEVTLTARDPYTGDVLATCVVPVSDTVVCQSATLSPSSACMYTSLTATITLRGPSSLTLSRLTSGGYYDVFGAGKRFNVVMGGVALPPSGFVSAGAWSGGIWRCEGLTASEPGNLSVDCYENGTLLCGVDRDMVECSGEVVFNSCPDALHTLGATKPLSITVTYTDPSVYSASPTLAMYSPADSLVACSSGCPVITGSWSSVSSGKRTYTGTIRANAVPGGGGTASVRLDVVHAVSQEVLGTCVFDVSDLVDCSIDAPSSVWETEAFDVTISATGLAPVDEELTQMTHSTNPGLFGAGNRFQVEIGEGAVLPGGFSVSGAWSKGEWECKGMAVEEGAGVASLVIRLRDNGTVICEKTVQVGVLDMLADISCPGHLHIWGAAKPLTITARYSDPGPDDPIPVVSVTSGGAATPVLLDSATGAPVNFTTGWSGFPGSPTRTWSGQVYVNALPGGGVGGNGEIKIVISHPSTQGVSGTYMVLANCWISVSSNIYCGFSLPYSVYSGEPFQGGISLTAPNGDTLTRLDGNTSDVVGIYTSGDAGPLVFSAGGSLTAGWVDGQWEETGLILETDNTAVYTIQLKYQGEDLCSHTILVESTEGDLLDVVDQPSFLHVYGPGKPLSLRFSSGGLTVNWSEWVISFGCTGPLGPVNIYNVFELVGGGAINFAPSTWSGNTWSRSIQAKTAPEGMEDILETSYLITVTFTKIVPPDSPPVELETTVDILVSRRLRADVDFSGTSVHPGEEFSLSIEVTDEEGGTPPRLPSDFTVISDFEITSEAISPALDAELNMPPDGNPLTSGYIDGSQQWDYLSIDKETCWEIRIEQLGEMLASATIDVSSADSPLLKRLYEALLERHVVLSHGRWGRYGRNVVLSHYTDGGYNDLPLKDIVEDVFSTLRFYSTKYGHGHWLMSTHRDANYVPVELNYSEYPAPEYPDYGIAYSVYRRETPNTIVTYDDDIQASFWRFLSDMYTFICTFRYVDVPRNFTLDRVYHRMGATYPFPDYTVFPYDSEFMAIRRAFDRSWRWTSKFTNPSRPEEYARHGVYTSPGGQSRRRLYGSGWFDKIQLVARLTEIEENHSAFYRRVECVARYSRTGATDNAPGYPTCKKVIRMDKTSTSPRYQLVGSIRKSSQAKWQMPTNDTPPFKQIGTVYHAPGYSPSCLNTAYFDYVYCDISFKH